MSDQRLVGEIVCVKFAYKLSGTVIFSTLDGFTAKAVRQWGEK